MGMNHRKEVLEIDPSHHQRIDEGIYVYDGLK